MGDFLVLGLSNNTLMVCAVFILLIFVVIIVVAFKYLSIFNAMCQKISEEEKAIPNSIDNTISQIESAENEELVDDLELVAVITTAIMASMGDNAPADGLIVRSIKKANKATWLRA